MPAGGTASDRFRDRSGPARFLTRLTLRPKPSWRLLRRGTDRLLNDGRGDAYGDNASPASAEPDECSATPAIVGFAAATKGRPAK
jgi:hypothetical protein